MKKLQEQLKEVSSALLKLSKRVEEINSQVKKLDQARKKSVKTSSPKKRAAGRKAPGKKPDQKTGEKPATVLDTVYEIIRKSRNGAAIATLKAKTDLEARQLSNALYKLVKKGKIAAQSRGVYVKK